ncbi:cytochrome o ubiquinol oxidase subunit I [Azomonas macrocytogenes]|uniref:Cytochrome bo(3) ubiquinol oxidase subunit 1 n=1 Tax=Azomonas macrocytogenes TaxID=69962 RepID=A0A839T1V1_AZOMA|nr:cytochrome o ubiquinol oxidase subunit I [Azomonas macrocytogenes]MBB3101925.1 cytochrome o ubiquinol oxidase subunit 1 [Azomonas macrocytogenes]
MFGKLTLDAIPFHEPIIFYTVCVVAILGAAIVAAITYFKSWGYLWREWLTSVDHKKIGIMYIIVALVMLVRGFADAIMMRTHLAMSHGDNAGILPPEHYDQVFTAHGVIMLIFVAMPLISGLMNIVVPLQIGARDVAFPFLNSLSFWLFLAGVVLVNISLAVGEFAQTGWVAYPPLSGLQYSPGVGVDYYIWSIQISGLGSLLTGVNFVVTILKMRTPGMTLMKMPIFTWTAFCSNILICGAFPILTAALALLSLDRYLDFHFFTNELGGNPMMYVNLFWAWGHPEVYILILPAFGVFSEVAATFSRKPLFGYTSMVIATMAIAFLSFVVWLHHFFTMGSGANVNAFFGIATMIIAVPTGVKIFTWLFTMYRGRLEINSMTLYTLGFLITFSIGGMAGVLMAVPGADFLLHNSLFLVAHFHTVIIGGAVFGYLVGITYWFPKATGFKLNDKLGKYAFWFWIVGFYVAFSPMYVLGFMGMTRRLNHYDNPDWTIWMQIAVVGVALIAVGVAFIVAQLVVSFIQRKKNIDVTGDPWDGRTLEWSIPSPPPFYNFAVLPRGDKLDAFHEQKRGGLPAPSTVYEPIHMPKNTGMAVIMSAFATVLGFALIWHIWWLAIIGFVGAVATFIIRTYDYDIDFYVQPDEIARIEQAHLQKATQA